MKKLSKIALVALVLLVIAVIPLYYYTRPDASQPTGMLQIKGNVANPANLSYTEITEYPSITLQVTVKGNQGGNGDFTYTGVTLKTLLEQAEINSNATSIFIQASDGYGTTLTLEEANKDSAFIAYKKDGAAMTPLTEGGEGPFRLIIADDEFAQRWIRGVAAIVVS